MERTATRPLPTQKVTPNEALIFGVLLCLIAEVYLFFTVNPLTAGLGLIVIFGYVSALYTTKNNNIGFNRNWRVAGCDAAFDGLDCFGK